MAARLFFARTVSCFLRIIFFRLIFFFFKSALVKADFRENSVAAALRDFEFFGLSGKGVFYETIFISRSGFQFVNDFNSE